jgi:hypothetical protein
VTKTRNVQSSILSFFQIIFLVMHNTQVRLLLSFCGIAATKSVSAVPAAASADT